MRIPRWTVYPALALIAVFLIVAMPTRSADPYEGAADEAQRGERRPPKYKRVVVLGIDGMDPEILRETMERFPERMASFRRLAEEGGVHPLGTSNPPQSPVAWSNFITGRNPGGHGIFDFIHRDPVTRGPAGSTTRAVHASSIGVPFTRYKLPLTGDPESNRSGESFWVTLARRGIPADIWRMPANFPVEPAEGVSFPGMMTPTLESAYGEYTFYTTDGERDQDVSGGTVQVVTRMASSPNLIRGSLRGPVNVFLRDEKQASIGLKFHVDPEQGAAAIEVGDEVVVLEPGQWSAFVPVSFDLLPMGMMSLSGVVRFYLKGLDPFELYASPVNFDPEHPATPVSKPAGAAAELAEVIGTYYTQGMAEEVNALKDEVLDDAEFMDQVELVYRERRRMLDFALDKYLEDDEGGLLFFYVSTIDLSSHMMWRHADPAHPDHDPAFAERDSSRWSGRAGSRWQDVLHDLYLRMDPVLAQVRERVGEDALLIVMSDHGFAPYYRKFSLNTWLYENGYLVLKEGETKELEKSAPGYKQQFVMSAVDWSKTRAYGMGFNALYLNLKGREGLDPKTKKPVVVRTGSEIRKWWRGLTEDQREKEGAAPAFTDERSVEGVVEPSEREALLRELKEKLEAVVDPATGLQVVTLAAPASEIYSGERLAEAPDMLVGYNAGYGNSDASSTGRIPSKVLEDNLGGTFNGNHLMDPAVVPGTLMANRPVPGEGHRLEDLTVEILKQYGLTPGDGLQGHPIFP